MEREFVENDNERDINNHNQSTQVFTRMKRRS